MLFNAGNLNSILIKNKFNNNKFKYFLVKLKEMNNSNNNKIYIFKKWNIIKVLTKQINTKQKIN